MRAAVLTEDRPRLEVTEVADPRPAPGEVVVAVSGCGICGSDLHLASQLAPVGAILGHEIAGRVVDHGAGVDPTALPRGTAVAPRPRIGCGGCPSCARGRPDHCPRFQLIGLERPGGFAEAVAVSAGECFRLPASLSPLEHALVEPFAIARHALRRAGLLGQEKVAVLGGGPIGLAVAHWSSAMGATVALSDPESSRRQLGTALGASVAVDPTRGPLSPAVREGLGGLPDVVFECGGRPGLIDQALELVGVNGRVVVVGICPEPDRLVPWNGLFKEVDVRFCIYYDRQDYTDTVEAFSSGSLEPSAMVTETIALARLPERFSALAAHAEGGKVIVGP